MSLITTAPAATPAQTKAAAPRGDSDPAAFGEELEAAVAEQASTAPEPTADAAAPRSTVEPPPTLPADLAALAGTAGAAPSGFGQPVAGTDSPQQAVAEPLAPEPLAPEQPSAAQPPLAVQVAAVVSTVGTVPAAPADDDAEPDERRDAADAASADPAAIGELAVPLPTVPSPAVPVTVAPTESRPAGTVGAPLAAASAVTGATTAVPEQRAEPLAGPQDTTPPAVAIPGPVAQSAPVVVAPAAGAEPSRAAPAELAPQLTRPLQGLRGLGDGSHVLTISITPDNLGPVTVRAHITGDVIRVELAAPTDQGREALKAILPELRRDLAQGGGQSSLDLSGGSQQQDDAPRQQRAAAPGETRPATTVPSTAATRNDSILDVLV